MGAAPFALPHIAEIVLATDPCYNFFENCYIGRSGVRKGLEKWGIGGLLCPTHHGGDGDAAGEGGGWSGE